DHSVTSNRSSEAPVHWRKIGDTGQTRLRFGAKLLKSLALPRGLGGSSVIRLCSPHSLQPQPMRASMSIGLVALSSANDSAMASATSASIRPELLALSNLRPPAGSRVTTVLAAHQLRTG